MKTFHLLTLSATLSTLIACTKPVGQKIQRAVEANQSSTTSEEWDHSIYNPEAMFTDWRNLAQSLSDESRIDLGDSICKELLLLSSQNITIFENEIRNPANYSLLSTCQATLLNGINQYYLREREFLGAETKALDKNSPLTTSVTLNMKVKKTDYSRGGVVVDGGLERKQIVLTFDDGPSPWFTRSILETLHQAGIKAHFFVLGKNARAYPSALQKEASDGHMIGSHTFNHRCIGQFKSCGRANSGKVISFEDGLVEIKRGHQEVFNVIGWIDPIFRFPYGAHTPELRKYLKDHGVGEFFWSIDSLDWKAQTPQNLLAHAISEVDRAEGGVILFHDIQRRTAEMLPAFIEKLYARGFTVVLMESADSEARHNSQLISKPKLSSAREDLF